MLSVFPQVVIPVMLAVTLPVALPSLSLLFLLEVLLPLADLVFKFTVGSMISYS